MVQPSKLARALRPCPFRIWAGNTPGVVVRDNVVACDNDPERCRLRQHTNTYFGGGGEQGEGEGGHDFVVVHDNVVKRKKRTTPFYGASCVFAQQLRAL